MIEPQTISELQASCIGVWAGLDQGQVGAEALEVIRHLDLVGLEKRGNQATTMNSAETSGNPWKSLKQGVAVCGLGCIKSLLVAMWRTGW